MLLLGNRTKQLVLNPEAGQRLIQAAFLNQRSSNTGWIEASFENEQNLTSREQNSWGMSDSGDSYFQTFNSFSQDKNAIKFASNAGHVVIFSAEGKSIPVNLVAKESGARPMTEQLQEGPGTGLFKAKLPKTIQNKWSAFHQSFHNVSLESFFLFQKYNGEPISKSLLKSIPQSSQMDVRSNELFSYSMHVQNEEQDLLLYE